MNGFATRKDRISKAEKIEAVLHDFSKEKIKNKKILDIGTGKGGIADYFSRKNEVYTIDILDQRKNKETKSIFKKVISEKIPFKDNSFDIVISNHVIEHIKNQSLHLKEIKRILKERGICYLATPNRLFPIEPHYKIPLIQYLPNKSFHNILRILGKYQENLKLLSYFKLKSLISEFFDYEEYTHQVIKNTKKFGFKVPILNKFPSFILKKVNFMSQTNIFILH